MNATGGTTQQAQRLRNSEVLHDTAPAYAYAYACTRKEPLPRLEQLLDPTEWDHLVEERAAIMFDSGMTSTRAQALALADTLRAHGPRGEA